MLRMNWLSAAAGAKYFDTHLEQGDYYQDDMASEPGIWQGKGAERLGLFGEVKGEDFKKLAHNRLPNSDEKLTPRDVPEHPRSVLDMSFSVPKGISLVALIGDEGEVKVAFQEAVRHTMQHIEAEAMSRVRDKGADFDTNTGNLIWSEYIHKTSRPVNNTSDPQLHIHAVVHNATYRDDKGRFMALQAGDLKRDAPYFEAMYFERLAQNLKALGYVLEQTAKGWDIAGIPQEIKDKYSRRTFQIDDTAERLGITDPELKALLGAKTRESKSSNKLTYIEQKQEWRQRLTQSELNRIESAKQYSQLENPKKLTAEQAMEYAIKHCFERQSVMSHRGLVAEAHKYAVGQVGIRELEALKPDGLILKSVNGQKRCTLDSILQSELKMLKLVREGKHAVKPLRTDYGAFRFDYLNDGQRGAVQHILSSTDRITMISGRAGVGKTTLMKEINMAVQAQGKKIFAYAPTAQASRTVLRADGFKEADTVASLLNQKDHSFLQNNVILIDEVGLLGVNDATRIFELAKKYSARVILSGDRLQHQAVSGSPALNVLENSKLIQPYHITEIVRQKGAYKQAVTDITNGQYDKAINSFEKAGWIQQGKDKDLYASIAKDYAISHHLKNPNLVVVPTHHEAAVVTAFIRKSLIDRNQLGKREREFSILNNLKLTEAEKSNPVNYSTGHVIEFRQAAFGFRRGDRVEVAAVDGNNVQIKTKTGQMQSLSLQSPSQFQVYERDQLRLRKGDLVRLTHNGIDAKGFKLNNGDRYKIKGFTKDGCIRLSNGKVLSKDFAHVNFGYTNTSFAAQGKSVPVVQVLMNEAVKGAINKAQFYISVSRGKLRAKVYTNNIQDLKQWIHKPSDKQTAHDVVGYPKFLEAQLKQADRHRRVLHYLRHQYDRSKGVLRAAAFKGTQLLRPNLGKASYRNWEVTKQVNRDLGPMSEHPIDWKPPLMKRPNKGGYGGINQNHKGRDDYER